MMKQSINDSLGIIEKQPKETKPKKYAAVETVIAALKIILWSMVIAVYLGLLIAAQEATFIDGKYFFVIGLIAGVFFVVAFALVQLLEVFVDVAKNTNQTNILLKDLLDKSQG